MEEYICVKQTFRSSSSSIKIYIKFKRQSTTCKSYLLALQETFSLLNPNYTPKITSEVRTRITDRSETWRGGRQLIASSESIQFENRGTHILTLTCGSWEPYTNGGGIPLYNTARKQYWPSCLLLTTKKRYFTQVHLGLALLRKDISVTDTSTDL